MGWVALGALAIVTLIALRLIGIRRAPGWFAVTALLLGASGYAVQQHATLPGKPVRAESQPIEIDRGLVAFRTLILPATPDATRILAMADANLRRGATTEAVAGLIAAIREAPRDASLWTGLGSALAAHDDGQISPAARFAFRRALGLAPRAPGPPFFLGMAQAQSGDLIAAKAAWLRALALAPPAAPWRIDIAERLVAIDQFTAMTAGEGAAPPAR